MNPNKKRKLQDKIAEKREVESRGERSNWNLKAVVREENYDVILQQIEDVGAGSPSEVVNSALHALQRLMDITGTQSFTSALYVAQQALQGRTNSIEVQTLTNTREDARSAPKQPVHSPADDALDGLL